MGQGVKLESEWEGADKVTNLRSTGNILGQRKEMCGKFKVFQQQKWQGVGMVAKI